MLAADAVGLELHRRVPPVRSAAIFGVTRRVIAGRPKAKPATGYTYARREPEKTALFQTIQQHLLTFEQEWTDKSDGRTLPSFVTDELHDFLG